MTNVEMGARAHRLTEPTINNIRNNYNDATSNVSYERVSIP